MHLVFCINCIKYGNKPLDTQIQSINSGLATTQLKNQIDEEFKDF